MSTPTVGLVGSRVIDEGLQNLSRKTVTDFTFPQSSRTPLEIGMPAEGTPSYKGPKTGDSYSDGVEDTQLLKIFMVFALSVCGTYMLQYTM